MPEFAMLEELNAVHPSYRTAIRYFENHRGNLLNNIEESEEVLLRALKAKGHFQQWEQEDIQRIIQSVLSYAEANLQPYEWCIKDEDYAENVYKLYCDISDIVGDRQQTKALLVTRIISIIYGCCPEFNGFLFQILGIPNNIGNLSLLHFRLLKDSLPLIIAIIVAIAVTNYQANSEPLREQAELILHGLHRGLEVTEEQRRIIEKEIRQ